MTEFTHDPGRLVSARKLAWRCGMLLAGPDGDLPGIEDRAEPVAAWVAAAPDNDDFRHRLDAVRFWYESATALLDLGADPADDVVAHCTVIHAWLTSVPGYGGVGPGTPRPEMTSRQLFLVRCLMLYLTQDFSSDGWAMIGAGILEYAGPVNPPVTEEEVAALLPLIFRGDPRVAAGPTGVAAGPSPVRSGCQFYATPTPEQAAMYKITDTEAVLGCENPVGGESGGLRFFVPVAGGAVRVPVCEEHGELLSGLYGDK
jgi:hypothetical protein